MWFERLLSGPFFDWLRDHLRMRTNCEKKFRKQIGNVFVFTICFDVGLAVLC
jgi:hypothetical protein